MVVKNDINARVVSVRETLRAVANQAKSKNWDGSRPWTREIKLAFIELAEKNGVKCRPGRKNVGRVQGEWLYDLVWCEEDAAGNLRKIYLALECEWGVQREGRIDGDFKKLVQARAELKVWIFNVEPHLRAKVLFEDCKKQIECFQLSQKGDRYLFAGFDCAQTEDFEFEDYTCLGRR